MNIKKLCLVAGILLILAILPGWPYSYYQILRIAILFASVIVAWGFYKSHIISWTLVFGSVALIFNPLQPIYLNKPSWIPIDFISAIFFFLAAYSIKRRKS